MEHKRRRATNLACGCPACTDTLRLPRVCTRVHAASNLSV